MNYLESSDAVSEKYMNPIVSLVLWQQGKSGIWFCCLKAMQKE